jgi:hypothetical protein
MASSASTDFTASYGRQAVTPNTRLVAAKPTKTTFTALKALFFNAFADLISNIVVPFPQPLWLI